MKLFKLCLTVFFLTSINFTIQAQQHNYDNQNTIYSLNNKVGIGTLNPGSTLEINGTISNSIGSGGTLTLFDNNSTRNNRIILGADAQGAYIRSKWSTGGTDAISFRDSANNQVMSISASGNVGIGTSSPNRALDIVGGENWQLQISNPDKLKRLYMGWYGDRNQMEISTWDNGNWQNVPLVLNPKFVSFNGNVGIGTTSSTDKLTVTAQDAYSGIRLNRLGTNPSDFKIYSGYNQLEIRNSQNQIKWVMEDDGKIGIGTTSPSTNLEVVNGSFKVSGGSSLNQETARIVVDAGASTAHNLLELRNQNGIVLKATGENVGIGTTNPEKKFTVQGSVLLGNGNHYENIILETGQSVTSFHGVFDIKPRTIPGSGTAKHLTHFKNVTNTSGTGTTRHNVAIDGNLALGTTTTGNHKLAVEGSIGAREIKVEVGTWSDFVFKKDYNLPTLQEVEKHIAQNGHLKDIPSATEVENNGIFLGEMDAKLLQKIEELTLYTIQQQKEIDTQKEKIQQIEKENTILNNLLKQMTKLQKRIEVLESK